jgi:V/A-type H+/Na+-transporting ATPase subunit D
MAKVKFSKTELKLQRDLLKRFTHFLPTLQLKKQQLQMEVMRVQEEIEQVRQRQRAFDAMIKPWIGLLALPDAEAINQAVEGASMVLGKKNIAGTDVPTLDQVLFEVKAVDLFATAPWVDHGIEALLQKIRLDLDTKVLERQIELLQAELRTTTQRVNLFEKVKIPECRANIRQIQIYLGDQQTAAVGRAKIAKSKLSGVEL